MPHTTTTARHPGRPAAAARRNPRGAAHGPARLFLEHLGDRIVPAATATISGTIYQDATGNGLSAGDTPLSAVTVKLYQDTNRDGKLGTGDAVLASRVTGAGGAYSFGSLAAGKYLVAESAPAGFIQTAPTPTTYRAVTLAAGQSAGGNDFANFQACNTGAIADVSFTITDPTLGTYIVTNLRGNTHQNDIVTATFTVTGAAPVLVTLVTYDAPGATFDAATAAQQVIVDQASQLLAPGRHSLTVHLPDNFYQVDFVCGAAIDHFGPAGGAVFYSAEGRLLSADNEGTQASVPATLSGVVYADADGNGVYAAGAEAGIAGVAVKLTGTNDLGQAVAVTTVTDATGKYTFAGVREGTYTIAQVTPAQAGYTNATSMEAFALGGTATPGQVTGIHVTHGAVGGNYNLPEVAPSAATITGVAYYDANGDGVRSAGETPLAGVNVTLTGKDAAGNTVSVTVATAADGSYTFAGLPAGTYTLTYDAPSGYLTEPTREPLPPGATASAGGIANIVVAGGASLVLNLPELQPQQG